MKLVIQQVNNASCTVDNQLISKIDKGYMILVGIGLNDTKEIVEKMANKVSKLRIFADENDKMNLSIHEVNGKILSISQFTLYADTSKGNRPSFTNALSGDKAIELYEYFNECLRNLNLEVYTGIFGAHMLINLENNGPITIVMDSKGE